MKTRFMRLALALVIGLTLSLALAWTAVQKDRKLGRDSRPAPVAGSAVGGPFTLIDHNGATRTDKDFAGQYLLIYFGFTFCPAICPTELQKMNVALNKIGPLADQVQPLFITIDPERDTQTVMAAYVKPFHPRLIGLTGGPEQVQAALKAYRIYARKVEDPAMNEYTMDHTSYIYLMAPDGTLLDLYGMGSTAAEIAAGLQKALAR